ncbi:MAG: type II 3-dehydroquinate dehydratase [Dehalococcoidia bacterium]|jgi:3-dehydroquinate dehydratase-2|nr:type II 3-dehydroquinate dehydratase [Dehalococcoidia bacterium]
MRVLVINGPNLNMLGQRDQDMYGSMALVDIEQMVRHRAQELGTDVEFFQSNSESSIIDLLQSKASTINGIIINAGALTHYGLSLRDGLADTGLPVVEVHISNVYTRERWRHHSVVAPVAVGQISGLGWRGYLAALEFLTATFNERATE